MARGGITIPSKSRVRHLRAEELMQDVAQKQLVNHQVSVVAIGHDDQAGFPWYRRYAKSCKTRITSAVHDEVAVLRVSCLPAQGLRNRVIDFCNFSNCRINVVLVQIVQNGNGICNYEYFTALYHVRIDGVFRDSVKTFYYFGI